MPRFPQHRQPLALAFLAVLLEGVFLGVRRLHPLDENVVWLIAAGLAASIVYLLAVFLVLPEGRPTRAQQSTSLVVVLLAAVAFRATLFSLPPTLSSDLYRYVWEGEIQAAGQNPYLAVPAANAARELLPPESHLPGRGYRTAYAPLTEFLFRLTARLDGPAAFKLLSVLFDFGALLLLMGLLRVRGQPPVRVLLYGWCPLVILEFAGSGHNDSLAVFALLLAIFLIIRGRVAVSIIVLAAATMTKWFAGVAAPVFLRRARWWGLPLFLAAAFAPSLPYLSAGLNLVSGLMVYIEEWRNNESLYAVLRAATGEEALATGMALGVVTGLAAHSALERFDPLRAAYLLIATLLLLSPSVFPWYVTWLVPFLCFFPHPAFLLFTGSVLVSYHPLIDFTARGVWRYTPWLVWLEYLPVFALLIWGWCAARRRPARAYFSNGGEERTRWSSQGRPGPAFEAPPQN